MLTTPVNTMIPLCSTERSLLFGWSVHRQTLMNTFTRPGHCYGTGGAAMNEAGFLASRSVPWKGTKRFELSLHPVRTQKESCQVKQEAAPSPTVQLAALRPPAAGTARGERCVLRPPHLCSTVTAARADCHGRRCTLCDSEFPARGAMRMKTRRAPISNIRPQE